MRRPLKCKIVAMAFEYLAATYFSKHSQRLTEQSSLAPCRANARLQRTNVLSSRYCLSPPCVADADIIFLPCGFLSFFFFYPLPNLSGRRLDVYHTFTHGVALVRISDAGLKRAASDSLKIQDAKNRQKFAICAPSYNFLGLLLRN